MGQSRVPILKTKLHRPSPARDAIPRGRLLERFSEDEDASLTLISAPAGYGKSTIISQWAERADHPLAWLSLDDGDNDLFTFTHYFVSALHETLPGACPATLSTFDEGGIPGAAEIAQSLANELIELESPITLVLDDFHRISAPEILRLLTLLLEHPIEQFHLVIVSRRDPQLALGSLRASGRLREIRMRALRFTPDESLEFLHSALPADLTHDELAAVADKADGWPVGLRLLLLRLRKTPDPGAINRQIPSISNEVRDYLVAEVLDQLPDSRLSLLTRLSQVERYCAPLCEILADDQDTDGEEMVEWLWESGLFAVPLDGDQHWFRLHHYFQEVLAEHLRREIGDEALGDLHSRASHWFEDQGLVDEAFAHGLKTPACSRAIDLIATPKHPWPVNDYRRIHRWLGQLPDDLARSRPGTLVELVWQAVRDGQIGKIEELLAELDGLLERDEWDPQEAARARANAHALHIDNHFYHDRLAEVVARSEQALAEIDREEQEARQSIFMSYAIALTRLGEQSRARQALRDAIRELADPDSAALIYSTECQIEALSLNIPGLRHAADRYAEFQQERNHSADQPWTHFLAATARYQANELEEAEEILAQVKPELGAGYDAAYFRHQWLSASLLFAGGREQEAMEAARTLHFQMLERSNPRDVLVAEALEVEFALRCGEVSRCAAWFEGFDPSKVGIPFLYPGRSLIYVRAALALGTPDSLSQAQRVLGALFDKVGSRSCPSDEVDIRILRALLHEKEGRRTESDADLTRAVSLATPGGAIRVLADYGPALGTLLQRLKLDEQGVEFIGRVLATFDRPDPDKAPADQPLADPISKREFEVLHLLGKRLSNKEIASRLFISVDTVKRHTSNLFGKLGVNRRADAVAKAHGLGLLE